MTFDPPVSDRSSARSRAEPFACSGSHGVRGSSVAAVKDRRRRPTEAVRSVLDGREHGGRLLLHLPPMPGHDPGDRMKNGPALTGHGAEAVRDAIAAKMEALPEQLRKSLTWDQGAEMAQHPQLRVDTGLAVYFCDPQSPWQHGTGENTNGLLRRYFPKGTDISRYSERELDAVATTLNCRPRKTLGWRTPAEAFKDLLSEAQAANVATTP